MPVCVRRPFVLRVGGERRRVACCFLPREALSSASGGGGVTCRAGPGGVGAATSPHCGMLLARMARLALLGGNVVRGRAPLIRACERLDGARMSASPGESSWVSSEIVTPAMQLARLMPGGAGGALVQGMRSPKRRPPLRRAQKEGAQRTWRSSCARFHYSNKMTPHGHRQCTRGSHGARHMPLPAAVQALRR